MNGKLLKWAAGTGAVAVAAGIWYEDHALAKKYPWHDGLSPHASGVLPAGTGRAGHISTVVRVPPKAARTSAIDTYLGAFYTSWTLRLEGWAAKKGDYVTVPPDHVKLPAAEAFAYANGLFQGVYRDDRGEKGTAMVAWNAPGAKPGKPTPGGIQVFTAQLNEQGELEISFGGAEWEPPYGPKMEGAVGWALHRFYSRYLLDAAKHKLEKMARDGE